MVSTDAKMPKAPRNAHKAQFGQLVMAMFGAMIAVQIPFLIYLWKSWGVPHEIAIAIFIVANAQVFVRFWYVPKPEPPPVWFERYVIWGYFAYTAMCLHFTAGYIALLLIGVHPDIIDIWLWASMVLGLVAAGLPFRYVKVSRVDIPIKNLPNAFCNTTIAHLTDLHVGPHVPEWRLSAWVDKVNKLKPDYIVLTGDFVAAGPRFVPALGRQLKRLEANFGSFAVMGNHDYFAGAGPAIKTAFSDAGIDLLSNQHRIIKRGKDSLIMAGVDDTWSQLADLNQALHQAPDDVACILLAHDPLMFNLAAERDVSLQLSGHMHGGQMVVPLCGRYGSPLQFLGVPWIQGLYKLNDSQMYLSAGLGTTGIPIRIGMHSEIPLIRLISN